MPHINCENALGRIRYGCTRLNSARFPLPVSRVDLWNLLSGEINPGNAIGYVCITLRVPSSRKVLPLVDSGSRRSCLLAVLMPRLRRGFAKDEVLKNLSTILIAVMRAILRQPALFLTGRVFIR